MNKPMTDKGSALLFAESAKRQLEIPASCSAPQLPV